MDIVIQSAEYSPIHLEAMLLEFLDEFYHEMFTEELFNTFK